MHFSLKTYRQLFWYCKQCLLVLPFVILFSGFSNAVKGQTTIWEEGFPYNDRTNTGSGSPTGITSWTADGYRTNNEYGVTVMDYQLRGRNTSNDDPDYDTWEINAGNSIDISGYNYISVSVDIRAQGNMEDTDYIELEYNVDDTGWNTFETNGYIQDNFGSAVATQHNLSGSTLRLRITMVNSQNSEYYYADNIVVTGSSSVSYCTPVPQYSTGYISNVSLNTIDNTTGQDIFTDYTETITTDLLSNTTYTLDVEITTNNNPRHVFAWIDWNQDGDFYDSGEEYDLGETNASITLSRDITVPATALAGETRMRIIVRYNNNPGPCDNDNFYGETEDYAVNIISLTDPYLSVLPSSIDFGYVASGSTDTQTFTLTGNNLDGSNVTIEGSSDFQMSTDGSTFSNSVTISGYGTSISQDIYVQFAPTSPNTNYSEVISNAGGGSPTVYVTVEGNSNLLTYCDAYSTEYDLYESITNVSFAGINNPSLANKSVGYTDYTSSVTPGSVIVGQTYPISISEQFIDEELGGYCKVFIDYNQNGTFDLPTEIAFESSYTNNMTMTGSITIPLSASLGTTRMRIVLQGDGDSFSTLPCGTFDWGEVEDYLLTINSSASPGIILSKSNIDFGFWPVGSTSSEETYTVTGINLSPSSGTITINAPSNFEISTTSGTDFGSSVSLPYSGSALSATTIYVVFKPTTADTNYSGGASHNGGNADPQYINFMGNTKYCTSYGNMDYQTSITLLNFNTLNNVSGKPLVYSDYTDQSTNVEKDQSYELSVRINTDGDYICYVSVWVDWNQDMDFDDAGEEYNLGSATNVTNGLTNNSPLSVTIPTNAVEGETRLRVSVRFNAYPTSCMTHFDGEVEDYTINVTSGCTPPEITISSPAIGESVCPQLYISQDFDAQGNLGYTIITYTVERPAGTTSWEFDYEFTGSTEAVTYTGSPNSLNLPNTTPTINTATYDLYIWIENISNTEIIITLTVNELRDENNCASSSSEDRDITINTMPAIGPFD